MVNSEKIQKGSNTARSFDGGICEELCILRKGLWASIVLNEQDLTRFTKDELDLAYQYEEEFLNYNQKILDLLNR